MLNLETRTIKEVTETLIDYRGKTPTKTTSGVKLITAKVIKDGFIINGEHEYIADDHYDSWMRRGLPKQWDILITTEAPLGEVAQLRTSERVALAQRVILLRGNPELIDQSFFYHALKSPFVQGELRARASGTTVLGVKQSELLKVRIPYYPLRTQRCIASILSAYDDLIENNTRRIRILEEMARGIYREWFVGRQFPNHALYANGELPEGWQEKRLGDVVTLEYGKGLKSEQRQGGEIPVYGSSGIVGYHNASLVTGPGIIVGRKGNVGSVFWSQSDFFPIDTVFFVRTNIPLHYVYYNLLHQHFLNSDAAVPGLNRNQAYSNPFIVPAQDILEQFENLIGPTFRYIELLQKKNDNLRRTRDLLLPKLVGGEIDVDKFDIRVE